MNELTGLDTALIGRFMEQCRPKRQSKRTSAMAEEFAFSKHLERLLRAASCRRQTAGERERSPAKLVISLSDRSRVAIRPTTSVPNFPTALVPVPPRNFESRGPTLDPTQHCNGPPSPTHTFAKRFQLLGQGRQPLTRFPALSWLRSYHH